MSAFVAEVVQRGGRQRAAASDGSGGEEHEFTLLSRSLGRALRLLQLLLRQLKLDAANARLSSLSMRLRSGAAGVGYVRDRFMALHRIGTEGPAALDGRVVPPSAEGSTASGRGLSPRNIAAALPKTSAWLQQTVRAMPGIRGYLASSTGQDFDAAVEAASTGGQQAAAESVVPTDLRTGRNVPQSAAAAGSLQPTSVRWAEVAARIPVRSVHSSEALFRAGLVTLVSGGSPAVGPLLPEVLALDAERLHALQNRFQSLVVVAASFLLVQQFRSQFSAASSNSEAAAEPDATSGPIPPRPAALAAWDPRAAKQRIQILLADPSLQLGDLVTELATAAGLAGLQDEAARLASEAQLKTALQRIVDPSGPAFKSLSNALAAALLLHMCLGGPDVEEAMAARVLGRVGGGVVAQEAKALAADLLLFAGVVEAVHGETVLEPLLHLIAEEGQALL